MARQSSLRASDADRDAVAERLRQAAVEGRLDPDELEQRLHTALRARTYGDLDRLLRDLPAKPVQVGASTPRRRARRRLRGRHGAASTVVALVILGAVLVAAAATFAWWMLGLIVFLVLRSSHGCRRHTAQRSGTGRRTSGASDLARSTALERPRQRPADRGGLRSAGAAVRDEAVAGPGAVRALLHPPGSAVPDLHRAAGSSCRRPERPAQHAAARRDDGDLLGRAAARRGRLLDHVRAGDGDRGAAGSRSGDLPRRLGLGGDPGGPAHGPDRAAAGDRRRVPAGHGRLRPDRAGDQRRLLGAADPGLPAHRRRERHRAADPHRGGRHVPARAPRARDLVRAVRLGVRRDPRAGGVRAAVRGPRARRGRADRAVAGGRRDQPLRIGARAAGAAGPEADRRADRRRANGRAGRRRRCARSSCGRASGRRCSRRWPASA